MIKLTFLGDLMCKKEMLETFISSDKYDFSLLFSDVKPLLCQADYVFANLETPISTTNRDLSNEDYCFCSPHEFAEAAKDAGIDFVSTANNHCLDRGVNGLKETITALDKIGLKHTGIFQDNSKTRPSIIDVKGIKIGVCAYTYGTNAFSNGNRLNRKQRWLVNLTQNQELSNRISRWCYYNHRKIFARIYNRISEFFVPGQLTGPIYEHRERSFLRGLKIKKDFKFLKKKGVDLTVLLMHHGGQYNYAPTKAYKTLVRKILKKQNVNIVSGTHEHVTHNGIFNRIKSNQIATYSLGNFNGLAGTLLPPFDKFAEYSVAWHVYVNENTRRIERSTFSILKTVDLDDGKISVKICKNLLGTSDNSYQKNPIDREQLLCDMQTVAFRFSGRKFSVKELSTLEEYPI